VLSAEAEELSSEAAVMAAQTGHAQGAKSSVSSVCETSHPSVNGSQSVGEPSSGGTLTGGFILRRDASVGIEKSTESPRLSTMTSLRSNGGAARICGIITGIEEARRLNASVGRR